MIVVSAPTIEDAPLEHARPRFSAGLAERVEARIETFLEAERAQLPLWFVVAFGAGIATWLWLPGAGQWGAFLVLALGLAAAGVAWDRGRLGRALLLGGVALAAGCALACARAAALRTLHP
jgi:competence protein ComEC